jgi:hypothetical protein
MAKSNNPRGKFDEDGFKKSSASKWIQRLMRMECVSVKITPDSVMIRDTKDATKVTLTYTHGEWEAFITGVKNGEFDLK